MIEINQIDFESVYNREIIDKIRPVKERGAVYV